MLTQYQKAILRCYDDKNLGATYFDPEKKFVWRCDIRDDADLAERYYTWREAEFKAYLPAA